jgi:cytochrome c oxidase assembly protein subunit 15
MAAVLSVALVWFTVKIWRDRGATLLMRCGAAVLVTTFGLTWLAHRDVVEAHSVK